jgi:hypothetical protein
MGEGVARAVSAHGQGKLSGVVDKAAGGWSKVVDTPFRRASFFYEARQAGFKTDAQLRALLTDDAHHEDLVRVSQKANREAIDYENLTPAEKEIVRRVVFFYPWVKGSTVYAGRLVREHPVKAAVVGELGKQGREETQKEIGNVPSYLEGVFKAGGGLVNPNSAAILQTPAQVAQAIGGLAPRASRSLSPRRECMPPVNSRASIVLQAVRRWNLSHGPARADRPASRVTRRARRRPLRRHR